MRVETSDKKTSVVGVYVPPAKIKDITAAIKKEADAGGPDLVVQAVPAHPVACIGA